MKVQLRRFGRTEKLSPCVTSEFKMIAGIAANIAITWKPGFRVREALQTKKMLLKYKVKTWKRFQSIILDSYSFSVHDR